MNSTASRASVRRSGEARAGHDVVRGRLRELRQDEVQERLPQRALLPDLRAAVESFPRCTRRLPGITGSDSLPRHSQITFTRKSKLFILESSKQTMKWFISMIMSFP